MTTLSWFLCSDHQQVLVVLDRKAPQRLICRAFCWLPYTEYSTTLLQSRYGMSFVAHYPFSCSRKFRTRLALPVYSCPSMMIDTKKICSMSGLLLPWVIVLTGMIFSLAFRASDSTGVMLIGFVTKMIIECLEWCTYHFRQVDNAYVAEVRHIAERTSKFEGE